MTDEARAVPVEGDRERQHPVLPGGTFEFREGIGQIVYVARDSEDRRTTTFVAEVHGNAVDHARLLAGVSLTGSGLDVERLARAQVRSGIDTFLPGEDRWISANEAQAAIAREYAALSGESGEPKGDERHGMHHHRACPVDGCSYRPDRWNDDHAFSLPPQIGESGEPKERPRGMPDHVDWAAAVGESGEPKEPTRG
jgi:hypothetical protein